MENAVKPIFVFIDEAGDFNFSKSGSGHYVMAAFVTTDPHSVSAAFDELKYEYLAKGYTTQVPFHANENSTGTKKRVVKLIKNLRASYWLHLVYADKHYAHPSKHNPESFYGLMGGAIASYLLTILHTQFSPVSFVFDTALQGKQREAFVSSVTEKLDSAGREFNIHFQSIKEDGNGIVADFYAWSFLRQLENESSSWFGQLPSKGDPFNIFRNGHTKYW